MLKIAAEYKEQCSNLEYEDGLNFVALLQPIEYYCVYYIRQVGLKGINEYVSTSVLEMLVQILREDTDIALICESIQSRRLRENIYACVSFDVSRSISLMDYHHTHYQKCYRMAFQLLNICDEDMARDYIINNQQIFAALKNNGSEIIKVVIEKLELEADIPPKYQRYYDSIILL